MIASVPGAAALALAAGAILSGPATGAEYRDTKDIFTIDYDDSVWSIDNEADGEFSIACRRPACTGYFAGCVASRVWVPFGTVSRLTRFFDARDTERAMIDVLAKQKAESDKDRRDPGSEDAPPQVVKPYSLNYVRGGEQPVYDAEFRVSLGDSVTRFVSFSTAARAHSLAFVCHVPEQHLADWRPRFDALMEGFRPVPRTGWRRILDLIGF